MSISRRRFLQGSAAAAAAGLAGPLWRPTAALGAAKIGPFLPTWESLANY